MISPLGLTVLREYASHSACIVAFMLIALHGGLSEGAVTEGPRAPRDPGIARQGLSLEPYSTSAWYTSVGNFVRMSVAFGACWIISTIVRPDAGSTR